MKNKLFVKKLIVLGACPDVVARVRREGKDFHSAWWSHDFDGDMHWLLQALHNKGFITDGCYQRATLAYYWGDDWMKFESVAKVFDYEVTYYSYNEDAKARMSVHDRKMVDKMVTRYDCHDAIRKAVPYNVVRVALGRVKVTR